MLNEMAREPTTYEIYEQNNETKQLFFLFKDEDIKVKKDERIFSSIDFPMSAPLFGEQLSFI